MPTFNVTITRSAYETATLAVEAESPVAAEQRIDTMLDRAARVDLEELSRAKGVKVVSIDIVGDDESSWEVL